MIEATTYQHNGVKISSQLTIHDSQIFNIFDSEKFRNVLTSDGILPLAIH